MSKVIENSDQPPLSPEREAELLELKAALISRLPTKSDIYLPTQKIDLETQVIGLENVNEIYAAMESHYGPKLQALRDKYLGRDRAFIIGNGPSLNETDLSQLRDEITFCVNGFFLKTPEIDWTPTFYVVEDHLVAEDRAERINAFKGPTKLFPAYLGYCLDRGDDTIFYNHRPRKSYPDGFDFSTDASAITYTGCTVTFSCMQLAHYMGFRELYLIGVDASYDIPDDAEESEDYGTGVIDMKSDDTNHFHPDYFGKGYRWHDPQVNLMIQAYEEAERETKKLNRPIYNATIGGMLEVFERRKFSDIFPDAIPAAQYRALGEDLSPEDRAEKVQHMVGQHREATPNSSQSPYPKVAIIDMTRIGHATATGELKATLFGDYPGARLMQVFSSGRDTMSIVSEYLPGANGEEGIRDIEQALDWVIDFDPDVVLFRPTPEKPELSDLAQMVYNHTSARFVTWIMDGWQDRLLETKPKAGKAADQLLQKWFDQSSNCLAISDKMARVYSERYGHAFTVISNAVNPIDWAIPAKRITAGQDEFIVRYSGGLAKDMSLGTLINTAEAIEALSENYPIRLEINTRSHWIKENGDVFDQYDRVSLTCEEMEIDEYRQWLMGGDATLIAYNFDPITISYVQYSRANKMPECLACGIPVIAIGPNKLATIAYLKKNEQGIVVDELGVEPIKNALLSLLTSRPNCEKIGLSGREFVFERHALSDVRENLRQVLQTAAQQNPRDFEKKTSARLDDYRKSLEPKDVESEVAAIFDLDVSIPDSSDGSIRAALEPSMVAKMNRVIGPVTMKHVLRFYAGPKAVVALFLVSLAALPALPLTGPAETAASLGPALAIALLLIVVARWVIQLTHAVEGNRR